MNREFWQGKKVLLTGHTGFKGTWLSIWLEQLGAKVEGYALSPDQAPSLFEETQMHKRIHSTFGDIRDLSALKKTLSRFCPEIVIHLAAQPLVKLSYHNPLQTYETNIMGTVHLFEAIRATESVKVLINVTTDKVYENQERPDGYVETDVLGGYDPYSNSKACSEMITASYVKSFFNPDDYSRHGLAVATARAGNVIGGGDWAKDRIVPDLIRAMVNQTDIVVRNPGAIRPWQHVLEPLNGYLILAEKLYEENIRWNGAWNFGPFKKDSITVKELILLFGKYASTPIPNVNFLSSIEHETNRLNLNIDKSMNKLGWKPKWDLQKTVREILEWHETYSGKAYEICQKQIAEYEDS